MEIAVFHYTGLTLMRPLICDVIDKVGSKEPIRRECNEDSEDENVKIFSSFDDHTKSFT